MTHGVARGDEGDVYPESHNDWEALYYCGNVYGGGAIGAPGRAVLCGQLSALAEGEPVAGRCVRPSL